MVTLLSKIILKLTFQVLIFRITNFSSILSKHVKMFNYPDLGQNETVVFLNFNYICQKTKWKCCPAYNDLKTVEF